MKPAADITSLTTDITATAGAAEARPAPVAETPSLAVDLYELTKPRMNFLVVITTMVGFVMASRDGTDWLRLMHTVCGTALTAACAAVLNQVIERRHDAKMPRTADRPVAAGRMSPAAATAYGVALGVAGMLWLWLVVNPLTAALGLLTLAIYLAVYTPLKRISSLNTVIGAIPGAIPPLMGFTAVENGISPQALAVFGILFLWQMPHFLAIAILYRDDYTAGGYKMLPCVDEKLTTTGRMIVLYAAALLPVSLLPTLLGIAGPVYFTAAVLLGLAFLSCGISCAASRTRSDARQLFFASIIYLPLLLGFLMFDKQ
jgi:protoheme IX farnesyltransferase